MKHPASDAGLLAALLVGCASTVTPQFTEVPSFAQADRVQIIGNRVMNTSADTRSVTNLRQIEALYRFISTQPGEWHHPTFDAPILKWDIQFFRKGKLLGSYGVGTNFVAMGPYINSLNATEERLATKVLTAPPTTPP